MHPRLVGVTFALALLSVVGHPSLHAQATTDRTPNLSGGWVGESGTIHFNLVHRLWREGEKVVNTPTMLLAVPLPGGTLLGANYATNSLVAPGEFNEWELFGRWKPLDAAGGPVDLALTAAYNTGAGSADGELALNLPLGPISLMGAGRYFSDALGLGEPGWAAAGGLAWHVSEGLTLSADAGHLETEAEWDGEAIAWGAGIQARIPTTPHTISIQATNTRTSTLQGSSGSARQGRTLWGFEFTVPVTLARYFGGGGEAQPATDAPPPVEGDTVEVSMSDALEFVPATIRIREGQTIVWRNPTPLPHTVTADPEEAFDPEMIALPEGAEPFHSGDLMTGDEFSYTFTVPGQYEYICIPHAMAGMVGTVIVEPVE